jgi:uncharacterized membrane protein HdeD (DUF308 family)
MFLKIWAISKFIVFTALSVCIFVFFDHFFSTLHYLVGSIILFYGIEIVIFDFVKTHHIIRNPGFFFGVAEISIGLCLIFAIRDEKATYAVWAMWSIFREFDEIRRHVTFWKNDVYTPLATLEAIAVIVLSLFLLVTLEMEHARIHLYLLGIELITVVILPICHNWKLSSLKRKKEECESE